MKTAIMLVTAVAAAVALRWTFPWWEWWMSIIFFLYNIGFMRVFGSGDSSDTDKEPPYMVLVSVE